jgi:DNA-binding MarR family transcriptional regulator
MKKYECLKLDHQLCYPLYLCSKEIIRKYTPLLNKLNLTYTQYIVMMYFWEKKTCNVKTLSKCLLIDSSTLTPLLRKLENKGYIERNRNKEDERNLELTLTAKGENLKEKAINIPSEVSSCVNLNEKDASTLYELLYKILNNIEKEN